MVQRLRRHASIAGHAGLLIPGPGTKILHTTSWCGQKKKKKKNKGTETLEAEYWGEA